tara:strand:+ start:2442 stop:2900 length:459 start_codon:yes stop_codon:yes gene_type:complete
MKGSHGEVVVVEHSEKAAKEAGVVHRKPSLGASFHRLVLNHRAKGIAGCLKVNGRGNASFMLDQKVVNGKGCINVGVDGSKGIEGGLKRLDVREHAFRGHVEVMKVGGLRFFEERLHVKQPCHFVMTLVQRVSKGPRGTSGKQTKTKHDEAH